MVDGVPASWDQKSSEIKPPGERMATPLTKPVAEMPYQRTKLQRSAHALKWGRYGGATSPDVTVGRENKRPGQLDRADRGSPSRRTTNHRSPLIIPGGGEEIKEEHNMEKTTAIKFFWNGIKLNGSNKLVKCFYSLDNRHDGRECVTIYARDYSDDLPGDLFPVENGTDTYTDYFETDRADLFPGHPLYPYARAAALKAAIRDLERYPGCGELDRAVRAQKLERYRAELAALPTTQPTAAEVEAVHAQNQAAEAVRSGRRDHPVPL